jgi:hypothetical protein
MRNRRYAIVGLLGLAACAGTGERADPGASEEAAGGSAQTAVSRVSSEHDLAVRESRVSGFGSYVVHNFNYTLVVDSPTDALAKARELVLELGGEITNASGNDDSANLNAVLPLGEHKNLRVQLGKLALRVENESSGRSEYAAPIEQAKRRLQRVESARIHLVEALRGATSRDAADALGLLMELSEQEKRNLESQLQSYREQTRGSQLYVSFVREPRMPQAMPHHR